jgi:prepilin-type N-terminal cleavage/methylation domain-containing protein
MTKNNQKKFINNKAFSLIELSIVILIIGILVAGVTQSSRLVKRFNLQSAQNITRNSPVPTIANLSVWYESVLETSFNDSEEQDQASITVWYDVNPLTTNKANAIALGTQFQPKFIENALNGLPAIRFDGSDDYLRSDNISIAGNQVTYFIVSARRSYVIYASPFTTLSPSAPFDNTSEAHFRAFLEYDNIMYPFRNGWGAATTHPGNNVLFMSCGVFNGSVNINYYNGVATATAPSTGNFNVTTILLGSTWQASAPSNRWSGDIGEIIIYSRALKTDERQDVEKYLAKKWKIKI